MSYSKTNKLINVPQLASHLEKKAGKEESFQIIKRAINGELLTERDWAVLYSYFLPPRPKKITNPYEWASIVCDQKESYSFCKYLLIEPDRILAANTKTAHVVYSNLGMKNGWYDIKKGFAGNDIAIMPNIDQVLDESSINDFKFENLNFDIIEAPTGLTYVLPWNKKGVNKHYFDLMTKSLSDIQIQYSDNGPFNVSGFINDIECWAVIMPFSLIGLLENDIK